MKSILLATDLAAEADRALERALNLATTLSAKLHILHVYPAYSFSKEKKSASLLKHDTEESLKSYLAGYKKLKNLQPTISAIEGREIFVEIIQYAEKVKASLIVMGMHSKAKLRDMFVGTTVERVIRNGVKPVLMVKDKPLGDYKNILVGTDFSAGSKQALHVALELAPKSFFHLVYSYDIPDTYIGEKIIQYAGDVVEKTENDKLERFVNENSKVIKKFGVEPKNICHRVAHGAAFSCLMQEADELKSDLLAIGTHSRAILMPYKLGGTAHDILNNPPCDVLVARGL